MLTVVQLFKKCVDEIGQLGGDDADQPVRHAEERMMKNVKIALVTEINELSKRFRADQRNYIQSKFEKRDMILIFKNYGN